jgi:hypothetical protein
MPSEHIGGVPHFIECALPFASGLEVCDISIRGFVGWHKLPPTHQTGVVILLEADESRTAGNLILPGSHAHWMIPRQIIFTFWNGDFAQLTLG